MATPSNPGPAMMGERFDLETSLTPEAASARLRAATEPVNLLRWGRTAALFEGRVAATRFRIRPITVYRRAFLPWFCGRINALPTGARLSVVMRPGYPVLVMSLLWIVLVAAAGEYLAWRLAPAGFSKWPWSNWLWPNWLWLALPPAIAAAILLTVRRNYRLEAAKQKRRFMGLFEDA